MKLNGIKANFFGDSITEGVGTSDYATKPFHQLIAAKYGMAEARNYGIGGTRFARQQRPSEKARWDLDFCSRIEGLDPDASLVVLFGGTNDYGHGDAPIGCFEDRTPDSFYGACHYIMRGLIEKFPEARVVVMTPLHRECERKKNANGMALCDYVAIIREVAGYYSLPVLDLFAISGIQPEIEIIKRTYCPDGLHPNDKGHERMAEIIGAYLENM